MYTIRVDVQRISDLQLKGFVEFLSESRIQQDGTIHKDLHRDFFYIRIVHKSSSG